MKHSEVLLSAIMLLALYTVQAQNPWKKYGYTPPKVLTLSDGKYEEFFPNDTIAQIGSVMFNTVTNEVVAFVDTKQEDNETSIRPEVISRFLSVDPFDKQFPELTPYQYASNRPIDGIDLDGLEYVTVHILIKDGTRTELRRENHYQTMTDAQISKAHHGISAEKFYKKYSAAFEKEGRGVKYVYYNEVNGQNVATGKTDWQSRQTGASFNYLDWRIARHGIYYGAGAPTQTGDPSKGYDYSYTPIDEIDALALAHDKGYDFPGYQEGDYKNSTAPEIIKADEEFVAGLKTYIDNVTAAQKEGKQYIDKITGKAASEEAISSAKNAYKYFSGKLEKRKEKVAKQAGQ